MAYIEQFTIEGLAGHERPVHRVLDRRVNIFWGLNGTGKTSLLKILNSALSNELSILQRVPFTSAEVIFWSTDHQARIRRTIERDAIFLGSDDDEFDDAGTRLEPVGDGIWREVERTGPARVRAWTSELLEGELPESHSKRLPRGRVARVDAPYRHSYMPISRLSQLNSRFNSARSRPVVDDAYLDEDFAEQVRLRWQAYNSDALAKIRSIQQQGLASILALLFGGGAGATSVIPESVPGDEAYALVRAFLSEQSISLRFGRAEFLRRYDTQSDLRDVVASIQDVTSEVEEALRPQHEFQNVIEHLYSGSKNLVLDPTRSARGSLRIELDGSPIPLQSLSSGEKQLLRLMLEILAAEDATVMIDEPELSMHVDWQQVLVASMQRVNPECQLLLATHSPEVMADVPDEFVFEL